MKGKVGGGTAVHFSKGFPFFTINRRPRVLDDRSDSLDAFIERLKFVATHRHALDALGVWVDGDAGFHTQNPSAVVVLDSWIKVLYGELASFQRLGCPTKQKWELAPFRFTWS